MNINSGKGSQGPEEHTRPLEPTNITGTVSEPGELRASAMKSLASGIAWWVGGAILVLVLISGDGGFPGSGPLLFGCFVFGLISLAKSIKRFYGAHRMGKSAGGDTQGEGKESTPNKQSAAGPALATEVPDTASASGMTSTEVAQTTSLVGRPAEEPPSASETGVNSASKSSVIPAWGVNRLWFSTGALLAGAALAVGLAREIGALRGIISGLISPACFLLAFDRAGQFKLARAVPVILFAVIAARTMNISVLGGVLGFIGFFAAGYIAVGFRCALIAVLRFMGRSTK